MTTKGFIFLMLVTIATVMIAGTIAEQFTQEGMERTLVVGIITAFVVFPAAKWAERRGWIKGSVRVDELGTEFSRKKQAEQILAEQEAEKRKAEQQASIRDADQIAAAPPTPPAGNDRKPDSDGR